MSRPLLAVLGFVLLPGCHPQLVLQLGGGVSAERAAWEGSVTERINDHDGRLQALEKAGGEEAPAEGEPQP